MPTTALQRQTLNDDRLRHRAILLKSIVVAIIRGPVKLAVFTSFAFETRVDVFFSPVFESTSTIERERGRLYIYSGMLDCVS